MANELNNLSEHIVLLGEDQNKYFDLSKESGLYHQYDAANGERYGTFVGSFEPEAVSRMVDFLKTSGYREASQTEVERYLRFRGIATPEEQLKDVEKAVEQNDNMLDGIINNGASEREIPGTFDEAEREAVVLAAMDQNRLGKVGYDDYTIEVEDGTLYMDVALDDDVRQSLSPIDDVGTYVNVRYDGSDITATIRGEGFSEETDFPLTSAEKDILRDFIQGVPERCGIECSIESFLKLNVQEGKIDPDLRKSMKLINEYTQEEFDSDGNFSDLTSVGLAFTQLYKDELFDGMDFGGLFDNFENIYDIQVDADLTKNQIITYINGDEVRNEQYDSLSEMNEQALSNLDFSDLINLTSSEVQKIADRQIDRISSEALDEHEAEFGADGSRVFPNLNDEPKEKLYVYFRDNAESKELSEHLTNNGYDFRFREAERGLTVITVDREAVEAVQTILNDRNILNAFTPLYPEEVLAIKIDDFMYHYDPYSYNDALIGTREENIVSITSDIENGNTEEIDRFFADLIEESEDPEEVEQARELNSELVSYKVEHTDLSDAIDESDLDNVWEQVAHKMVFDSNGFQTDYTMYRNTIHDTYACVFGDNDIYRPEDGNFDFECDTREEAFEWFDSYAEDTLLDVNEKELNEIENKEKKNMNFDEFKAYVQEHIKEFLPEKYADASVTIQNVTKNNDTVLSGLMIRNEDNNIAPNIYLENFFDQLQAGRDINDIMQQIGEVRVEHEMEKSFDVSRLTDFDQVKDHIIPKLINSEMNADYLSDKPYTMVNDLAVAYAIDLGGDANGHMSAPITNSLMEQYGTSIEELHSLAMNSLESQTLDFKSMIDVLMEMMGITEDDPRASMLPPEEDLSMYVLTNSEKINGATAILSEKKMDEIAEQLGGNFFVIPSSIHEVIVLPIREDMNKDDLEAMINDVNSTQVAPEERLSDNLYGYNAQEHKLVLAGDLPELSEEVSKEAEVVQFPNKDSEVKVAEDEGIKIPDDERKALNESAMKTSEIINRAEEKMAKETISISVPSALVGEPYYNEKFGKEQIRVKIPPKDSSSKEPWSSFIVDPAAVKDGENGRKDITLLAEGSHTVYTSKMVSVDENGKPTYANDKVKTLNTDIKATLDARTAKVVQREDKEPEKETVKISANCVGKPFTSNTGAELVSVKVPNQDPADKSPWATFVVGADQVSDKDERNKVTLTLSANASISLKKTAVVDGKNVLEDAGKLTVSELKERFAPSNIKNITNDKDKVKEANAKTQDQSINKPNKGEHDL